MQSINDVQSRHIQLEALISAVANYLNGHATGVLLRGTLASDNKPYLELLEMILDIRFQTDFNLMTSFTEVQALYDQYRTTEVGDEKIQLRTLMDLAVFIRLYLNDQHGLTSFSALSALLSQLITTHSNVDINVTCQDAIIYDVIDAQEWQEVMNANPWLISAVIIRLIPADFIMKITQNAILTEGTIEP